MKKVDEAELQLTINGGMNRLLSLYSHNKNDELCGWCYFADEHGDSTDEGQMLSIAKTSFALLALKQLAQTYTGFGVNILFERLLLDRDIEGILRFFEVGISDIGAIGFPECLGLKKYAPHSTAENTAIALVGLLTLKELFENRMSDPQEDVSKEVVRRIDKMVKPLHEALSEFYDDAVELFQSYPEMGGACYPTAIIIWAVSELARSYMHSDDGKRIGIRDLWQRVTSSVRKLIEKDSNVPSEEVYKYFSIYCLTKLKDEDEFKYFCKHEDIKGIEDLIKIEKSINWIDKRKELAAKKNKIPLFDYSIVKLPLKGFKSRDYSISLVPKCMLGWLLFDGNPTEYGELVEEIAKEVIDERRNGGLWAAQYEGVWYYDATFAWGALILLCTVYSQSSETTTPRKARRS